MNSTNFTQTGGWPLDSERLQEMQTAYSIFNSLGALAGNLTIISGCETVGTIVKNGFVYINGELLEFREATVAVDSTVIIIEYAVSRAFKNGVSKQVHTIRYATFGTAGTSWLWSDFKRPLETKDISARLAIVEKKLAIFQPGGVAFPWFKPANEIPEGFQEVLDMRGRTIIGYDPTQAEFDEIEEIGGAKDVQLIAANIPELQVNASNSAGGSEGGGAITTGNANEGAIGVGKTPNGTTKVKILNPYRIAMYIEYSE
jgi:hypothetical protein